MSHRYYRTKVEEEALIRKQFLLFDEKRKKEEHGPIVFYFVKEIFSHYGIPDSQYLCMLINWKELFPPRFKWDKDFCNRFVSFNPEDETHITFTGPSWSSSVLAQGVNPSSFTISLLEAHYLAIGIAPKEGFTPNKATMFSCGCYLYTENSLYSGGMPLNERHESVIKTNDRTLLREPKVYTSGSILTCFYNRKKGELSFTYNGFDLGVAYSNIPLIMDFYAAVSVHNGIGHPLTQVKLLDMTFDN